MNNQVKKVILYSKNGYSKEYDSLLNSLIDEKIYLFCTIGKDCELWEDVMDQLYVGFGDERDFDLITTSHPNEVLDDVIEFAKIIDFDGIDNQKVKIIEL